MIAIETHFVGPSNTRGSRIVATTCNDHRLVKSYDHSLNSEDNHRAAAEALANKMDWLSDGSGLVGGATKRGYAFVFVG